MLVKIEISKIYKITSVCFLSQPIMTRLRAIFDLIIMFQEKQSAMVFECLQEVETRATFEELKHTRAKEVSVLIKLDWCRAPSLSFDLHEL